MQPKWLDWAQRLQALAQTGLNYGPHIFDLERYEAVRQIAAEMMAAYTDAEIETVMGMFTAQAGHATPKIDVRGVVFRDNAILMVRENLDGGRWTLPGGWADINESPAEATVREVYEESGYRTRAIKLLALYDRNKHHPPSLFHAYKVMIRCELIGDAPEDDHAAQESASFRETGEATFFREDQIPQDLSIGRITRPQILRFFEHQRNPDLPTDFD